MVRLVPGTVVEQLLGQAAIASPEVVASFRAYFGLDRPVHVQYAQWLGGVLRGDLGVSWLSGRPVIGLFVERLPVSAELAVLAVGWSLLLGIPLGTGAAVWREARGTRRSAWGRRSGCRCLPFGRDRAILLFSIYLGWMPSLSWAPLTQRPSRT